MKHLKLLIVEDSESDAFLLLHHLKKNNYVVDSKRVETKEEMSEAMKEDWDLILSDHSLPTFSSTAALSVLEEANKDIPLIILSGTIDPKIAIESMRHGAKDFIMKDDNTRLIPVIERELEECINRKQKRFSENESTELRLTLEEITSMQEQLVESKKMAALGCLVAGVAHEINTPLGVSITGITLIQSETEDIKKAVREKALGEKALTSYLDTMENVSQSIYISLKTAAKLVHSFKQVAVDQHVEEKRNFNLKEYFDEVLLSLHNKLKYTRIRVVNDVDNDIFLFSYAGIYSQVLTNFIMNSLLHAFDEGDEGVIRLQASMKTDFLLIIYEDNGKGLKEEVIEKMFNPFFTTKLGQGGTGLGLNIVFNLINHKLHGTIKCESILGKGIKLIISIPKKELVQ